MSATSRAAESASASDVAASLAGAPLARLLVRRDGDAVAAAGVLARALRAVDVPVQATPTDTRAERERRADAGDPDAVTVAIGPAAGADATLGADGPAAATAAAVAEELGVEPAYHLALAGVVAAGDAPERAAPDLVEAADGVERRPGVGLACEDVADGLAASTLFHAPFSGDPEAAADALVDAGIDPADATAAADAARADDAARDGTDDDTAVDDEHRRTLASLVALAATDGPAPDRAAETVERALRPLSTPGPVPTVEGHADLLDGLAAVDPGAALALATHGADVDGAASAWRDAARAAHAAVAAAGPARYDDVVVLDAAGAAPQLVARIARDCTAPEPVAVAVGDAEVGVATVDDAARAATEAVAEAIGGEPDASRRRGVVRELDDRPTDGAIADAVRDARTEGAP